MGRPQKEDQKRLRKGTFLSEKLFQTLSYMPGNRLTTGEKKKFPKMSQKTSLAWNVFCQDLLRRPLTLAKD